ncbi:hypothetical protein MLD38_025281 [Melastoma candidum]|uniref:Uncharacterized protein n=1 Tax=Melastoma candidum TaxID=119954 RepID=A0ACB9NYD6_9MYRT|nr:hypothetical protein MLD38_025281 [Melastoma candidum]
MDWTITIIIQHREIFLQELMETTFTQLLQTPTSSHFCHRPLPPPSFFHFSPAVSSSLPSSLNIVRCRPSPKRTTRPGRPFCPSIAPSFSMASSTADGATTTNAKKPARVLFVCLGNICRSPAAEGVFRDIVKRRGLDGEFGIDSAGTIDYHEGNPADPRMRAAAKKRGVEITSISRPIRPSDFQDFDIILAMDKQNRDDILRAFNKWKVRDGLPEDGYKKVRLMCSYCKKHDESEVPDPYYGGPQGFETVLDLLEDACESLLESILAGNALGSS